MPTEERVSRAAILGKLTEVLEPLEYVHALWEGGAAAFRRVDAWSDIDVYVLVDDAKVPDTFRVIDHALGELSSIQLKYEVPWPESSGISQAFYRLRNTDEYLLVDLAVLRLSAPDKYLERELHGEAVFHFNKGNATVIPTLDRESFVMRLLQRRDRLRERLTLFGPFVQKEINRENWIEAVDAYRVILLDSLLEFLRMKYNPAHYTFRTRYVHYELPSDVVRRFERLAFVGDAGGLARKYREAMEWCIAVAGAVDEAEVRRMLGGSA